MKTIAGLQCLSEYGFTLLTGESCNLGLRILCDIDGKGLQIFCRAFGLAIVYDKAGSPIGFPLQWNSGVASVMLGLTDWETLAVFALLTRPDVNAVWQCESLCGGHHVYYGFDEMKEKLADCGDWLPDISGINERQWVSDWKLNWDTEVVSWSIASYGKPIRRFAFSDSQPNDGLGDYPS